jgi:hypothetical protein
MLDFCTCKVAVVFNSEIKSMSAWSETTAQPGDQESTSPQSCGGIKRWNSSLHGTLLQQFVTTLTLLYQKRVIDTQGLNKDIEQMKGRLHRRGEYISRDLLALELSYQSRRFQIARDIGKRPAV